jgi:hypothetical protein
MAFIHYFSLHLQFGTIVVHQRYPNGFPPYGFRSKTKADGQQMD